MNELSTEKTVTTKELAEMLGVSIETIRTTAKDVIDPSKFIWRVINGGKSQVFDDKQATAIKIELQNHSKIAKNGYGTLTISNDLEMMLIQQKLTAYQSKRIQELEIENAEEHQKRMIAENSLNRIANAKGCFGVNTAAKALKLPYGNRKLFEQLRQAGILNSDNSPKQDQVNAGHFKVIVKYVNETVGNVPVTLVTGKGLVYLAKKLNAEIDDSVVPDYN